MSVTKTTFLGDKVDSISAIPQQPQLGKLAQFLRYLETQSPEFLPKQLDVMGLVRQLALPQASTVENLSYGNLPFTMPPEGTGAMIPQVKTGRKAEVADLVSMLSGVPGGKAVADVGTKISNEAADALVRMITRNPQATAPGVIQETAMPFMQAVAPKMPGLLAPRSELGFYSALEEAVGPLQNKGTGTQFLAQLEKTPGVKPEEIKWTGLDDFLKSRQNVTKAEVQDYLAQNRVNLQEVRLGGATSPYPYRTADEWQGAINRAEAAGNWDEAANLNQAWEAVEGFGPAGSPKFSQYTLPGGENYREILLTLESNYDKALAAKNQYEKFLTDKYKTGEGNFEFALDKATQEEWAEWVRKTKLVSKDVSPDFSSSHFDQPNILAHMRVNDRVVDGKKTLFIEEIQSDWHQAGRKYGYSDPQAREQVAKDIKDRYGFTIDENTSIAKLEKAGVDPETVNRWHQLVLNDVERVPNAPFKTTWHELTLKRAIQEAAEKGYDKIAFTTGKTQAERYDLSKQLDKVKVRRFRDEWVVEGYKGNTEVLGRSAKNNEELSALIGKDLAEKAIKDNGGSYSGIDLQVGGEGMKGFYDQILPKSLEKLGKKFDARVGKSDMDGVEVWSMDITPKMRESVLTKGQPLFQAAPLIPAAGLLGDEGE